MSIAVLLLPLQWQWTLQKLCMRQSCFSCLPGRQGRCQNTQSSSTSTSNAQLSFPTSMPTLNTQSTLYAQSSAPCSTSTQKSQDMCDEEKVSDAEAIVRSDAVESADVPLHTQDLPRPSAMAEAHFTWRPDEVSSEQFIQPLTLPMLKWCIGNIIYFLSHLGRWAKHLLTSCPGYYDRMLIVLHWNVSL